MILSDFCAPCLVCVTRTGRLNLYNPKLFLLTQGVFKLSTRLGREFLLRAPTDAERDVWTHAIGAIIRQLDGMHQVWGGAG